MRKLSPKLGRRNGPPVHHFSISLPAATRSWVARRTSVTGLTRSRYVRALVELDRASNLLPRALSNLQT